MCAMKLIGVWPDHDVIDESFIVCGFEWAGVFSSLPMNVLVYASTHGCAEFLQVVFFIEFECVKFENHFQ